MRFVPTTDGFNLNYFDVVAVATGILPDLQAAGNALHPNYPNPFNPATTIRYDLQDAAIVNLAIYDVTGKLVKTLVAGEAKDAGPHEMVWNGRDEAGRVVATGVYFYRLDTGGYSQTRKMVMVK
jgi:hypothetical protein